MDKKTFTQFILLSAFIVGGYLLFTQLYATWQPAADPAVDAPPPRPQVPEEEPRSITAPEDAVEEPVEEPEPPPVPDAPPVERDEIEEVSGITLENEYVRASWTNRGAALEKLWLRQYKAAYEDPETGERPTLLLLKDFEEGYYGDLIERVTFLPVEGEDRTSSYPVTTSDIVYEVVEQTPSRIVFEGDLDRRLTVRKAVTIEPDAYHYNVDLTFINRTEEPLRFTYRLRGPAGISREVLDTRYLASVVGVLDNGAFDVQQTQATKLTREGILDESRGIAWGGTVSQFFVSLTWPREPGWVRAVESRLLEETDITNAAGQWSKGRVPDLSPSERREKARTNGAVVIISTEQTLEPASRLERGYRLLAAPQLQEVLGAYDEGLLAALRAGAVHTITWLISLGTLTFLTPLMISILDFFYGLIPNYGVAIILLTLLVRGVLHPLTKSGQMSMHKMKLLQPKIKEMQKKYGDQREKVVQEQMKLYSKYGVHPLSGCWPMLLQMPVFIALFTALRTAAQLRQATFIPGWITDLSQADTVWHFPFHLPVLGNELNILPFIMVVMWMLNQQLTPTPADAKAAQQQKIMKWMPVLFAVMFYQFPSGLLLYITASSGLGALQNWWIRRQARDLKLETVEEKRKRKEKKGKKKTKPSKRAGRGEQKKGLIGRMMEKLEEQEKQSQQIRNKK